MFGDRQFPVRENEARPIRIFISYKHSPDDDAIKNKLLAYIRSDAELAGAKFWTDRDIIVGDEWKKAIRVALAQADIAIVLVSQEYLASEFIRDVEVKTLLERRERGELVIMPLILSACNWKAHKWLETIQYFPSDNETIMEHYQEAGRRNRLFQKFLILLLKRIEEAKLRSIPAPLPPDNKIVLPTPPLSQQPTLVRPAPLQPAEPRAFSGASYQQVVQIMPDHPQSSVGKASRISTFQIISTSIASGAQLFNLLKEPIMAPGGQTVSFKPTRERPNYVFFILEEGETPEYAVLRSYLEQHARAFFILFTQDKGVSIHTLGKKAELLRAEIFARTKVSLTDIYACSLAPESRNTARLLHALV